MANIKKTLGTARINPTCIAMSDNEKKKITNFCKANGLSVSGFLIQLALKEIDTRENDLLEVTGLTTQ